VTVNKMFNVKSDGREKNRNQKMYMVCKIFTRMSSGPTRKAQI